MAYHREVSSPLRVHQGFGATELRPMMASCRNGKHEPSSVNPFLDSPQPVDGGTTPTLSPQITTSSSSILDSTRSDTGTYRVYKRRWFGLVQLTLLNIIVSWDWLTFAPVSTTSAKYFSVTESDINWLSTAFLFAFVVATPAVMWVLNRGGPKPALVASSALILAGNWIRYGGTRTKGGNFAAVMFGQILIGLAQPFVLAAPTRYSDLWFSDQGRIAATAVASLANPLGGASTIATLPSPFLPHRPPTPPSATSMLATADAPTLSFKTLRTLFTSNTSFLLIFLPFTIYVSAFNSFSSLLNAIMYPYGFDETTAGLTGALLIVVGLVAAAVTSPFLDRSPGWRLPMLKGLCVAVSAMYLAFVFAPATRTVAAPYALAAVLGAASFSLVPLSLEMLVEVTWPISPEVSSCVCWAGGQLGGGLFIIIMDAMQGSWADGEPAGNMKAGLVFLAVFCWLVLPLPLLLGYVGEDWQGRGVRRVAMG
ncbi:MAG: hypothetical protein M1828_002497 [Chrysothrix sp. TS-e1954]|nr:MAG: hypothetical protein M1828_002497 [Chrysothrix sp. TS-e1954]